MPSVPPLQMPFGAYGPPQAYARPPAYDSGPPPPSRSQPVRRRRSYSSSSSDSDAAAEISARIMGSSNDPRELNRIMRDTRKPAKGSKRSKRRRQHHEASPKVIARGRRSNSIVDELIDPKSRFARRSMSPFVEDEIPAALDVDYFNDPVYESPTHRRKPRESDKGRERKPQRNEDRKKTKKQRVEPRKKDKHRRRRSMTEEPRPALVQPTRAIVPVSRDHRPRTTEKDQIGERVEEFWDPMSIRTGKRQRLPRLDWRKGERYITAQDGTVIGKVGYTRLVCDDTLGYRPRKPAGAAPTTQRRPVDRRSPEKKPRRPRRESVPSTNEEREQAIVPVVDELERPLLNAFDFLQKDEDGIYCLGRHRVLHRATDRKWGDRVEEGGFRLCPSISTEDAYIAEIALEPGHTDDRAPESLLASQVIYGRVLQAGANSIRLQIMGKSDERLSEEDEFFIEQGSTYLLTNLSQEKTAVLSLVAFE